jgi:collagenase-like PrtC family protease
MKLAVGYQLPDDTTQPGTSLLAAIARHRDRVGELYFALPGEPSGRLPLGLNTDLGDDEIRKRMETDLQTARDMGIALTLLFNAACYGEYAVSRQLADHVCHQVHYLREAVGLSTVTTTSPMIAAIIKEHFPAVRTRASVNMRIGTISGAEYVAPYFDEFHLQREYNRDLTRVAEFKAWCDREGKRLHLLVNSGCMPYCSGQSFHDNLVAHDRDAGRVPAVDFDPSLCRQFYLDPANWVRILQSTWIRPEDLHHYAGLVDTAKLATRMHHDPSLVIAAYATSRYDGDLLDLLEPGHGPMLGRRYLDNGAFPADWFEQTSTCAKDCHQGCGYCAATLERVLKRGAA